ncbi:tyrosinase-like isoform X2 [Oculina patagonica]
MPMKQTTWFQVACIAFLLASMLVSCDSRRNGCQRNRRYGYRRFVYDQCGQRCLCLGNFPVQCTRIRKEFTSMSVSERERYVKTIHTASTDPRYKTTYDNLITEHRRLFRTRIHERDHFLTWHRYYLLQYENLMRRIDCRFTVAFWDWSLVSADPWQTSAPSPWHSGSSGMGGNGMPPNDCVRTGLFRKDRWSLPESATEDCLTRNFDGMPPDAVAVEELLRTPASQFETFEQDLRTIFHNNVHCLIGGTMCSVDAAAAPEFFLHHGMIDKIWDDWQSRSSAHKNAHFPNIDGNVYNTSYTPRQLIDLNRQPSGVRVVYQDARIYAKVETFLAKLSFDQLGRIPRVGFSGLLPETVRLFRISASQLRRAMVRLNTLQPTTKITQLVSLSPSSHSVGPLGFRLVPPDQM